MWMACLSAALRDKQALQNLLRSLLENEKQNEKADDASFAGNVELLTGLYERSQIVTLNAMCAADEGLSHTAGNLYRRSGRYVGYDH